MGGSMGAVVGEKVTRAAEHALAERIPLIVVSASGGARMQEGTLALMQLAKTLAAIERLRGRGRAVHLDPVRPDDGRRLRVVRGRRRRQCRRAERADRVRRGPGLGRARSPRSCRPGSSAPSSCSATGSSTAWSPGPELRDELVGLLRLLPARDATPATPTANGEVAGFRPFSFLSTLADRVSELSGGETATDAEGASTAGPAETNGTTTAASATAAASDEVWARVQLARNLRRPRTLEFVAAMTDDFVELHGDRLFGDDEAMVAGLRQARRPADRRDRPAEGRRHRREHPAQLRDAAPRGLPQGDAGHGARRAVRPAGRHVRRRPGRPPGPGVRGARHRGGDRPVGRR